MPVFLGVRFLASEYPTGKTHRGRIDSLGLDENGCPVIIEYKRSSHENVINQGLFYLDWLLDHRAEFQLLVMRRLGQETAEQIEWPGTRLLCIAADFTRYDAHAVQQIPCNIELLRYRLFGEDLLLLELVNANSVADATAVKPGPNEKTADPEKSDVPAGRQTSQKGKDKSLEEQLVQAPKKVRTLYAEVSAYLLGLGEDVQEKQLKLYTAFRRLKNFACLIVQSNRLLVTLKLDPASVALEPGFSRDISAVGHKSTGDLELILHNQADFERAMPLLARSYSES
ncbi:DUF5655 domain-containing protein [Oecophyllibacter saccharovorans]|uniref:DUF5655 domain-containing protein n=1 Tax=Oecophyllibacter saccharovorans TaxID=2558360 RepID=UPI001E461438|nr:DUF5655 domain-containing protein [Oecophyllibacter saccharovorans]